MESTAWLPPLRACSSRSVSTGMQGEDTEEEKTQGTEENVRQGVQGERKIEQENAKSSLDALNVTRDDSDKSQCNSKRKQQPESLQGHVRHL